jgi:hypothetical protein
MTRPPVRRLAAGLLVGLALTAGTLVAAPAASAADPLPRPTVSHTAVKQGEFFTVAGTGCFDTDGDGIVNITITSPEGEIGNAAGVNADGSWSFREAIGKDGTYRLQVTCDNYAGQGQYPLVAITVGDLPVPPECAAGCTTVAAGQPLTQKAVVPGEKHVLRLTGYLPNEVVTLVLHSTPQDLGTFTADSSGTLTVTLAAPAGTTAGAHNLVVTRADGTTVSYPVTIAAAAAKPQLASTGADVTVPLVVGIGLEPAGAGALFLARRGRGAAQA